MAKTGKDIERCAACDSDDIVANPVPIIEGRDRLTFDYECNECGHKGEEVHKLKFSHMS